MNEQMNVPRSKWVVQGHRADGTLMFEERFDNIVFDAGIADVLLTYFKNAPQKAGWNIGLVESNAVFSPTDTIASHPGWTENTNYVSATRPALTLGEIAGKELNNNSAKAVFVMSGLAGNIAGGFIVSNSTKGGATGLLYAAALFPTGVKNMSATDTLTIAVTLTGA